MTRRVLYWSVGSLLLGAAGPYMAVVVGYASLFVGLIWALLAGRSVWNAIDPEASFLVHLAATTAMALWTLTLLAAGVFGLLWLFSLSCRPGQSECPL